MKIFVLIFLLLSNILYAKDLLSIRIASFQTQTKADEGLISLHKFIQLNENIQILQEQSSFKFKVRKSGKHYITLVEPFVDKVILQKVLDTLRITYKDIYVTRIKKNTVENTSLENSIIPILPKFQETNSQEKVIPELLTEVKDIKSQDILPLTEEVAVSKKVEKILNTSPNKSSQEFQYIWQIISLILCFILLYSFKKIFQLKQKNEVYFNNEFIQNEKFHQLTLEIQEKEKYLSHTSHELRSPMTAIMGLTHIVLESDLGQQEKDYIKQIERSATNLLNIVNDILDISKIKAGELHIEKEEFNINNILEYISNIIAIQAKNNNINYIVNIDSDIPSQLIGDSLRLGQVLINLLGNAVKFTKDGEVSLNIKKISSLEDKVTLQFIVSDDGIGISDSQLETIFQSFSQAQDSTSRKFGGTGLGLSISQELVQMMHGKIKVQSKIHQGSTFSFSLVFKIMDPLNSRQYRLPSKKYLHKKILIIDSSPKNVVQLTGMLDYFNYKIHTIPSFEESIVDESMEFDIVIINKDQFNTINIQKLLEMQKKQNFKIVLLRELFTKLQTELLTDLPINTYLQIPFNQQNVLNMLIDLDSNIKTQIKQKTSKNILANVLSKKILIAEDNQVNHKVISGLLAHTSIQTTFVNNGQEVLDTLFNGDTYDLILMDINMPLMDGYRATKEIRKHNKYDTIPILAFTADVMEEAITKAYESGMQEHISKPIIIDIFYKKIYDALNIPKTTLNPPTSIMLPKDIQENEYEEILISIGLQRYNNDKEFFSSILKDFKKMYINSALDLEEFCTQSDYKAARIKAMDIKDVSLSIGAYNLCESIASIEYELEKGSRSNWRKLIASYELELEKLFKDIDKYLKRNRL